MVPDEQFLRRRDAHTSQIVEPHGVLAQHFSLVSDRQRRDAFFHFLSRFVGKSDGKNVFEIIRAVAKGQPQILFGKCAGFAWACRWAIDLKEFFQNDFWLQMANYELQIVVCSY